MDAHASPIIILRLFYHLLQPHTVFASHHMPSMGKRVLPTLNFAHSTSIDPDSNVKHIHPPLPNATTHLNDTLMSSMVDDKRDHVPAALWTFSQPSHRHPLTSS